MAKPQEHLEPGVSMMFSDPLHLPDSSLRPTGPQLLPSGEETRLTDAAMGKRLDQTSWPQPQNSRERLLQVYLKSLGAQLWVNKLLLGYGEEVLCKHMPAPMRSDRWSGKRAVFIEGGVH